MKNTDILSRINAMLSKKIELEQQTLENGTVVEAESFAVGEPIFAIDGESKEPLEIGEYVMADGTKLYVTEIGKIGELELAKTEDDEEKMSTETETETEKVIEELAEVPPTIEEVIAKVMEAVQPKLDELQSMIDMLAGGQTEMKETLSSVSATKPTIHKPREKVKMSEVKVAPNTSATQARVFAMLSGN
jgi:hypothetical protein